MERRLAEEVLASIPDGKVRFPYFKDRYALQLLAYAATEGRSLSDLRRGRFRPLLQKPTVRRILSGRRGVDWTFLDTYFPEATEDYVLTFGLWGAEGTSTSWYQTTRPGINIVIQLNFPPGHDRAYRRYIEPGEDGPFEVSFHPIHQDGHHTLAWSRIDIDSAGNEALIEEVQSDWVREAGLAAEHALASLTAGELERPVWLGDAGCDALQLFRYVEYVLRNHRKIWDQAVMAASLWLLRERLGIRCIYMHTYDSGCILKGIAGRPPRSIYERVPRQFCFERVIGAPEFLERDLRRSPGIRHCEFWQLRV